jgi:hypothetical protein
VSETGFVEDALRSTAAELFGGGDRLVTVSRLLDLGWNDLAADDLGIAVSVLAEQQGQHLGVSRLLELAMSAAGPSPLFDPQTTAIIFSVQPSARAAFPEGAPVDGIVLADGCDVASFVVPVRTDDGVLLRLFDASGVDAHPVAGIDAEARVHRVHIDAGRGGDPVDAAAWDAAVAAGSLAVAHELLGAAAAMLNLAVGHVTERRQFGVPIGSFQAVQHRLADVLIDITAGRAVCRTAWLDRDRYMSAAARSAAGRAFESALRQCQQVLGAMGATWEYPLHRYQRRGLLLERLLDPAPVLAEALTSVAVEQRRVEVLES